MKGIIKMNDNVKEFLEKLNIISKEHNIILTGNCYSCIGVQDDPNDSWFQKFNTDTQGFNYTVDKHGNLYLNDIDTE